jgi:hypothetical protein
MVAPYWSSRVPIASSKSSSDFDKADQSLNDQAAFGRPDLFPTVACGAAVASASKLA